MNFLLKAKKLFREKASAKTATAAIVISILFAAGYSAKYVTKKNDSQMEQVVEQVLEMYAIDYDFSPDEPAKDAPAKAT